MSNINTYNIITNISTVWLQYPDSLATCIHTYAMRILATVYGDK